MDAFSGLTAGRARRAWWHPRWEILGRACWLVMSLVAFAASGPARAQADVFIDVDDHRSISNHRHVQSLAGTARDFYSEGSDTRFGGHRDWIVTGLASLAEGRLSASALEQVVGPKEFPGGVRALVNIAEDLTFSGPRSGLVAVQMTLHGAFNSLAGPSILGVNAKLLLGADTAHPSTLGATVVTATWDGSFGAPVRYQHTDGVTQLGSSDNPRDVRATLRAEVMLDPGDTLHIEGGMTVYARTAENSFAHAAFDNTALLSIELPPEWSFTSASGVFLASPAAPVPEPGVLALLLAGLTLLAALVPRVQAQEASAAVWTAQFTNPNPAGHLEFDTVTTGRASVASSGTERINSGQLSWISGAHADLRRGAVGVAAQADRTATGYPGLPGIYARAELNEVLTFHGSRAGIVGFSAGVTGSFNSVSGSRFEANSFLFAGGLSAGLDFEWTNNLTSPGVSVFASPGTTGIGTNPASLHGTMHLLRLMQPGETISLQLNMLLKVGATDNDLAIANFGHTAQLAIALPEGMSFTSASGDFMADAPLPAVPEPDTWALLLAGGVVLGLRLRRRPGSTPAARVHTFEITCVAAGTLAERLPGQASAEQFSKGSGSGQFI